jgi:hypothetical protein
MKVSIQINRKKAIEEGNENFETQTRDIPLMELSETQRKTLARLVYGGGRDIADLHAWNCTPNPISEGFVRGHISPDGIEETRRLLDLRAEMYAESDKKRAEMDARIRENEIKAEAYTAALIQAKKDLMSGKQLYVRSGSKYVRI